MYLKTLLFLLAITTTQAQNIKGSLPQFKNNELRLMGYTAAGDTLLSSTTTDALGNFTLPYPKKYVGASLLQIKGATSAIVLLHNENIELQWDDANDLRTLNFKNSPENVALNNVMNGNQEAEAKLSALKYLTNLYKNDPEKLKWLNNEIATESVSFDQSLKQLPKDSYTRYYATVRKLVTDMPQSANRYPERIPQHEAQFNALDFNNKQLHHSGLLTELLDGYVQLMESYGDLSKVYEHLNTSTDHVIKSLAKNPTVQQEVATHLFNYMEKRSLFAASEHLALAMLNQEDCMLDSKRESLFEQYRKMAVGKPAPELVIENSSSKLKNISDLKSAYKLVVFASSGCPNCIEELPKLKAAYPQLNTDYNLEVVLVSLDTEKEAYTNFVKDFPGISSCDFKGWDGQNATAYSIFATPTLYLLDTNNTILLKPNSTEHLKAWLQAFHVVK